MVDQAGANPDEPFALTKEQAEGAGRRRVPILVAVTVLALVLLGGSAFAALRIWQSASIDPAERLPESPIFYADFNLDPRSDQTANLLSLLEKFDEADDLTDVDSILTELLDDLDLDGVDPDDVKAWLGTRGAVGVWVDVAAEDFTMAFALASRNDDAARENLAAILEASDDEFGYVVDDGLAVLAFTENDPQARAEEIVADGREAPLAQSQGFQSSIEWLDDEQLAFMWVNFDEFAAMAQEIMALEDVPADVNFEELYDLYGMESAVVGVVATDSGFEVRYRSDGYDDMSGKADWRDRIGELRASQVGAIIMLPDNLSEMSEPLLEAMDELYGATPDTLDDYYRGQWDYDLAVTDDEQDEYFGLYGQWELGSLGEDDPEFERFLDLDDRFWLFGTRSEYDDWIAAGYTDEEWRAEQALTHEEFYEFVELETLLESDELPEELEERFFELDARLFAFGVVSDYPGYEPLVDPNELVQQIYDLASGATFTLGLGNVFTEPDIGIAVELAEGPAERLLDLPIPGLDELVASMGDDLVFDGSTAILGDLDSSGGTLSEHPRFEEAFAGMPDEAHLVLFADVQALNSTAPEPTGWLEPVSTVSMVQGADGTGMIRVLID